MTTLRQIITDAFRENGLVQVGLTPSAEEFDEGLRKLQGIISSLYGNEMGDPLVDLSYGSTGLTNTFALFRDASVEIDSSYLPCNTRLLINIDSAKTLYLDPNPEDGSRVGVIDSNGSFGTNPVTLNGNGRSISGGSTLTLSTASTNKNWFYRADLGEWTEVTDLTANSQNPFPKEFDEYLTLLLTIRLNPRYQTTMAMETAQALQRMQRQFRSRYKQVWTTGVEEGLIRLPSNTNYYPGPLFSNLWFNRGRVY